jgi:cytochrome c heme-lyase
MQTQVVAIGMKLTLMLSTIDEILNRECKDPTFVQFKTMTGIHTPRARFFRFFGFGYPYERQDWTVSRCGKTKTYIVEMYTLQTHELQGTVIGPNVRPKIESFEDIKDRIRMSLWQWFMLEV